MLETVAETPKVSRRTETTFGEYGDKKGEDRAELPETSAFAEEKEVKDGSRVSFTSFAISIFS